MITPKSCPNGTHCDHVRNFIATKWEIMESIALKHIWKYTPSPHTHTHTHTHNLPLHNTAGTSPWELGVHPRKFSAPPGSFVDPPKLYTQYSFALRTV